MPIHRIIQLRDLSQEEFDRLDSSVMRHAYAAQNKLGRLFHESIYENELAATLRAAGHEVHTQTPVKVAYSTFEKTYYLDLVVDQMIYELKALAALIPEHEAQALHYAMLMDVRRTKLLNFGADRVQGKLCFTPIDSALRRNARFDTTRWRPQSYACERLMDMLRDIIADWGTHLSIALYNDALVHFNGGETNCLQRIPVADLGKHIVQSHAPHMAFVVTSLTRGIDDYRLHLTRFISHMELTAIQWFNLNHSTISCETLG